MASAAEIAKSLEKLIGGNDESATVKQWLDLAYPELNYALSNKWDGGFPVGRIIELAGPASSGKTAIATYAMAAAQRAGGIAFFCDHEHSFDEKQGAMLGLDITKGRFFYKKPRTFEEAMTMTVTVAKHVRENKLIPKDAPLCAVFDSLASQVPSSVLLDAKTGKEKDLGKKSMHDNTALARATSASMPAFNLYAEELGICVIFLNQIRMKIGVMYGDPRTTPGGEAPKFYASQRIMLGAAAKITKSKEDKEVQGMQISAGVIKNKVARPFRKAEWRFMFQADGSGRFDVERSLIDWLIGEKLLTVGAGNRASFVDWNGKSIHKEVLAREIEKDGKFGELLKLLPAAYEPPKLGANEMPAEDEESKPEDIAA
jgi:recombination protein RecA